MLDDDTPDPSDLRARVSSLIHEATIKLLTRGAVAACGDERVLDLSRQMAETSRILQSLPPEATEERQVRSEQLRDYASRRTELITALQDEERRRHQLIAIVHRADAVLDKLAERRDWHALCDSVRAILAAERRLAVLEAQASRRDNSLTWETLIEIVTRVHSEAEAMSRPEE